MGFWAGSAAEHATCLYNLSDVFHYTTCNIWLTQRSIQTNQIPIQFLMSWWLNKLLSCYEGKGFTESLENHKFLNLWYINVSKHYFHLRGCMCLMLWWRSNSESKRTSETAAPCEFFHILIISATLPPPPPLHTHVKGFLLSIINVSFRSIKVEQIRI